MTVSRTLLVKSSLTNNTLSQQINFFKPVQIYNQDNNKTRMSNALVRELDLKMQQVREYGLIAHGYHNENFQYPVHVRRSHDGEKLARTKPIISNTDKSQFSDSTILTPSSHENRTKIKQKDLPHRQYTILAPPNKTINDINPIHRKSSLTSVNSSPIICSIRPYSIASISLPTTDEQHRNSLSNSSQSLINQSPQIKTLTQRFFSKLFHHPSKS